MNKIALRNTVAIIAFVIAVLWAISVAQADGAVSERAPLTVNDRIATSSPPPRSETARTAIRKVFRSKAPLALRVAWCESRMNPRAVGSAGERGLLQIHPVHFHRTVRSHVGAVYVNPGRLFDAAFNARVGFVMSRGGTDWGAWTCRP